MEISSMMQTSHFRKFIKIQYRSKYQYCIMKRNYSSKIDEHCGIAQTMCETVNSSKHCIELWCAKWLI